MKNHSTHRILFVGVAALALVLLWAIPCPAGSGNKSKQGSGASASSSPTLVWPLPPEKPRIRYIEQFSNNFDIEPKKKISWVDRLVGNPNPNRAEFFEKPAGIATDSAGRLLIASLQRSTVFILDKEKNEVIRVRGDRGVALQSPLGLVVDSHDNFYVADPMLHMVLKFDRDAHLQGTIGPGEGMKNPTFMAVDQARDRLYVVDSHLHQVLVYKLDTLQYSARFGKRGVGKGEFNYPVGIAVSRQGTIAVTDTGSCSVELFTPNYKFIRQFGQQGMRPGDFVRPKGVAFDSEGNIWVVDAAFNNVQIFDPKGVILMFVGTLGSAPGAFNLPLGIYIDAHDRVYISDQLNSRVQIFQFLGGQ